MRPDMRMFTFDPVTKKTKVDHGFNVYPPSENLPDQSYYSDHNGDNDDDSQSEE